MTGRIFGVGLGPGDPELITLKAKRLLEGSRYIAYFSKKGNQGRARAIAAGFLPREIEEIPLIFPFTTEIDAKSLAYGEGLRDFYDQCALKLTANLEKDRDITVLCEGDPMMYGSFIHLFIRLKSHYVVEICAGISAISGCAAAAMKPMAIHDEVLTIIPATLSEEEIMHHLQHTDAAVIIKLNQDFNKIRRVLQTAGVIERAIYIENGTTPREVIYPFQDLSQISAPYFSLLLIPGKMSSSQEFINGKR